MVEDNNAEVYSVFNNKLSPSIEFEQYLTRQDNDLTMTITLLSSMSLADCTCDKTGSISTTCDPIGGQCTCKHNVIGRTCDQCAPGTYNFSPRGCTRKCRANS